MKNNMDKVYTGITRKKRNFEVYMIDKFFIELMQQNLTNYTNTVYKIPCLPYKDVKPVYIIRKKDSEPKELIINILKVYPIKRPVRYNHYNYSNGQMFFSKGIANVDKNLKEIIEKDKRLKYFFETQNERFYSEEPELVFTTIQKAIEYIKNVYE